MPSVRRLTAILAADVAGYSRLMGADEQGTLAALRAIRRELLDPTIAAHNGRLFKTTGDGLLIEFSSVVDALRCASEIQREMGQRNASVPLDSRIEFRIGIHQGDVVVEDTTSTFAPFYACAREETRESRGMPDRFLNTGCQPTFGTGPFPKLKIGPWIEFECPRLGGRKLVQVVHRRDPRVSGATLLSLATRRAGGPCAPTWTSSVSCRQWHASPLLRSGIR